MGNKKGGRGRGRRQFVTSAEDLAKRNANVAAQKSARQARRGDDDDSDEDDDEMDEMDASEQRMQMEAMRQQLSEIETKKVKVFETNNPNLQSNKPKKVKDLDGSAPELTRREREELEKQAAEQRYRKLHADGKTDEYKADMERLQAARKRREEQEQAKKEAAAAAEKSKSKIQDDSDDDDALDARTVKGMKPTQLKEALKKRGLSTQGQKKELTDRLLAAI